MSGALDLYRPVDPDDEPAELIRRGQPEAYTGDRDELHDRLVRWFEESEMARQDEIALAERDRAYYSHEQWTKVELEELKKRGQPPVVINKIADKIGLLCGMERKARTDPKAFARNPQDEDRADAATQVLRYIADDNTFSIVRSQVFENMLIGPRTSPGPTTAAAACVLCSATGRTRASGGRPPTPSTGCSPSRNALRSRTARRGRHAG
jgi:hypothetical protein